MQLFHMLTVQDFSETVWPPGASRLPLPLLTMQMSARWKPLLLSTESVQKLINVCFLFQSRTVKKQELLQSFVQALISLNI